jgi:hypothetical protein
MPRSNTRSIWTVKTVLSQSVLMIALVAVSVASTLVPTTSGPDTYSLAPAAATTEKLTEAAAEAERISDPLPEAEVAALSSIAADAIRSGRIVAHLAGADAVEIERAHGVRFHEGSAMLVLPVVGSVRAPSSISVMFDASGKMGRILETRYQEIEGRADLGRVTLWVDAELKLDRLVDDKGNTFDPSSPPQATSAGNEIELVFSWTRFEECMNRQGIPSWILAGISIICGAVCIGTAGLGCISCIAAAVGFGSGVVAACVAYANE